MSWEDRLRQAKYTSPSGKEFVFKQNAEGYQESGFHFAGYFDFDSSITISDNHAYTMPILINTNISVIYKSLRDYDCKKTNNEL